MRFARKVDANQALVVHDLRKAGYTVEHTHQQGSGFPDLVVKGQCGRCGAWAMRLVEVKDGRGKLTPQQVEFHAKWRHFVIVARDATDVINAVTDFCCPQEAA